MCFLLPLQLLLLLLGLSEGKKRRSGDHLDLFRSSAALARRHQSTGVRQLPMAGLAVQIFAGGQAGEIVGVAHGLGDAAPVCCCCTRKMRVTRVNFLLLAEQLLSFETGCCCTEKRLEIIGTFLLRRLLLHLFNFSFNIIFIEL